MTKGLALMCLSWLALASLSACDNNIPASGDHAAVAEHVTATGATVRLNPNPVAPSAAYFTLSGGASDAVLIGASSSDLARAEMHESRMDGGLMVMEPIARLPIPAGEEVVFRQGGRHVMLFGISDAARTRGNLTLNLDFADGPDQVVVLAFPPQQAAAALPADFPACEPCPPPPGWKGSGQERARAAPPLVPPPPPDPTPAEMDHSTMDHGDHDH